MARQGMCKVEKDAVPDRTEALFRWQRIFATLDLIAVKFNLNHSINYFAMSDVLQRCLKQFSLEEWHHIGNDDDEACMDWRMAVQCEEIRPIIGNKGVVALQNRVHQLPVLGAAQSEKVHMIRRVARRMCKLDQGSVQAFVNQEFCAQWSQAQATARRWCVTRTGFCFAHGRWAGRPLRGNACM